MPVDDGDDLDDTDDLLLVCNFWFPVKNDTPAEKDGHAASANETQHFTF